MTAVDCLVKEMIMQMGIRIENTEVGIKLIEEANEIHKDEITSAYEIGFFESEDMSTNAADYYERTFDK